jgi:hypothetical protein
MGTRLAKSCGNEISDRALECFRGIESTYNRLSSNEVAGRCAAAVPCILQ